MNEDKTEAETLVVEALRAMLAANDESLSSVSARDYLESCVAQGMPVEVEETLNRQRRLAALGELTGSVVHEIRNPIGVIKNSIYFLRLTQKMIDEKAKEHLALIEDEIDRVNHIVSELLDFVREAPTDNAGRVVLQDVAAAVLARVSVPEAVEVSHLRDETPLIVEADQGQLERILENLLSNAVQAMPEGGRLSVECRRRDGEAVTTVSDTGVGIAPEDLARVFEPLFTRKPKGVGLGLTLSLRYAQANRGRIECESELGQGATFRLVLPVKQEDATP